MGSVDRRPLLKDVTRDAIKGVSGSDDLTQHPCLVGESILQAELRYLTLLGLGQSIANLEHRVKTSRRRVGLSILNRQINQDVADGPALLKHKRGSMHVSRQVRKKRPPGLIYPKRRPCIILPTRATCGRWRVRKRGGAEFRHAGEKLHVSNYLEVVERIGEAIGNSCPRRIFGQDTLLAIEVRSRTCPATFREFLPVVLLAAGEIHQGISPLGNCRNSVGLNLQAEIVSPGPFMKRPGISIHKQVGNGLPEIEASVFGAGAEVLEQVGQGGREVVASAPLELVQEGGCPVGVVGLQAVRE